MWMASLGKREFLETVAGSSSPETMRLARKFSGKSELYGLGGSIATIWQEKPVGRYSFPILAVTDQEQIRDLLAALNASPKALSPFTSFCRLLDYRQAANYFNRAPTSPADGLIDAVGLLSLVEVQLLSEGQIRARQVSPAAARRTLSFAWARGLAAGLSTQELDDLGHRWLEAYELCSSLNATESIAPAVQAVLPVLTALSGVLESKFIFGPIERLLLAIMSSDATGKEAAWREATDYFAMSMSLREIENAPREERGAYLQRMFKSNPRPVRSDQAAALGFLATQVAPGSLEHLDIVLEQGGPEAAFWYVLFASLQAPQATLNAFGGLGRRIARDVRDCETVEAPPRADIALDELRLLSRVHSDNLDLKVGHSNELEVELLPGVSATFRFGRQSVGRSGAIDQQAFRLWNDRVASDLRYISSMVEKTLAEVEAATNAADETKKSRRRRF